MMVYFAATLGVIGGVLFWRFAPVWIARRRARMVSRIIAKSHVRAGVEIEVEIGELAIFSLSVVRIVFRLTPDLLDEHYEELENVQALNTRKARKILKWRRKR